MTSADKVSHEISIPRPLSDQLKALARQPGGSQSRIAAAALTAFFERKGEDELERRFAHRLDRMSMQLGRIERNSRIDLESLALFIRYMLTINAPLPEADKAAQAIGRDRFAAFIERVGQQLARGRTTLMPEDGQ